MKSLLIVLLFSFAVPAFGQGKCGGMPCPEITPTPKARLAKQSATPFVAPPEPNALTYFWDREYNRRKVFIGVGILGLGFLALWVFSFKPDERHVDGKTRGLERNSTINAGLAASWLERGRSRMRRGVDDSHLEESQLQLLLDETATQAKAQLNAVPFILKTRELKDQEELLAQATKTSAAEQLLLSQKTKNTYTQQLEDTKCKVSIAEYALRLCLTEGATTTGMTVADYSTVNRSAALDRAKNEVEYEKAQNDIRAALMYTQEERLLRNVHKDDIFKLFSERRKIEASDDIAKDDKLDFLNHYIQAEVTDFRGLLQTSTRKNLSGGDETSDA